MTQDDVTYDIRYSHTRAGETRRTDSRSHYNTIVPVHYYTLYRILSMHSTYIYMQAKLDALTQGAEAEAQAIHMHTHKHTHTHTLSLSRSLAQAKLDALTEGGWHPDQRLVRTANENADSDGMEREGGEERAGERESGRERQKQGARASRGVVRSWVRDPPV